MRPRQTLAFKVVATGLCFLLLALGSIAVTLWATWHLEGGGAAVNEAGRMRMMSYRLALAAGSGERTRLAVRVQAMDDTVELLRAGDPSRPLFIPWNDDARAAFAEVRERWSGMRSRWLAGTPPVATAEVDAFVDSVDRFVSSIEQRLSHWTTVLRAFLLTMLALAVISAILLLYAMHMLVLDPLRRLEHGMNALRGGDFKTRVHVSSHDEFGALAAGFNAMAERLQALYLDLEGKVREKTARLEDKRQRLAALYEISAFIVGADNLQELATGFAAKIRRIANADAVAVRWSDERNERYLMLAADGLPEALMRQEQCLATGNCHCGRSAAQTGVRVVPIRSAGAGLGHCARAGFTTVLSVPVTLHHRVLGEVDLFYRQAYMHGREEFSLLETLASHLAGGIEGLHGAAAEKEAAVANERTLLARELHDSIAQSLAFLKIQVGLLRDGVRRGNAEAIGRAVDEIEAGVRESYGDVRELLVHFRTRATGEDIETALRTTLSKFEHQTALPTRLEIEGHGVPLPADVQVQVLHVLQEALSNVRKHAHATQVVLRVQPSPNWRFEVIDNGCGFDPATRPDPTHVGLRIMRERAERIGATVQVHSGPSAGTRVVLSMPGAASAPLNHETADTTAGR
jgi:two-component system nitrate/nitrite sensor histidine kinase NarX